MAKSPLISIGMPAFNAAAHIGLALEGLLGQSHGDLEVIVSDNASADGTRDVVESYRKRDARIRYERQPENIGANRNYSHVVRRARGEFFKWSSASDWCAPELLACCLRELQAHDDTVLVSPRTYLFQDDLRNVEVYDEDVELLDDAPTARLARLHRTIRLNNAINGLIRLPALRRTRLVDSYRGADVVLMGHLALLGKFRLLDQRLFYRRMEPVTATALQDAASVWRHHYPQRSARALFQGSKRQLGRIWMVVGTRMTAGERLRALALILRIGYWERAFVLEDLAGVWRYFVHRAWPA